MLIIIIVIIIIIAIIVIIIIVIVIEEVQVWFIDSSPLNFYVLPVFHYRVRLIHIILHSDSSRNHLGMHMNVNDKHFY